VTAARRGVARNAEELIRPNPLPPPHPVTFVIDAAPGAYPPAAVDNQRPHQNLSLVMTERRFNEAEVAAILEKAAEAQHTGSRQLPSGEGMTLAELQAIGSEVGIDPRLVAEAANALDRVGRSTSRKFLGLPIGVGRTIDLDRKLSDDEWERLVVDLRETFDARGTIRNEGSFRQWTNGNLQALVEPTATGHRVRLRTVKGDAVGWITGGLGMVGVATVGAVLSGVGGDVGVLSSFGFLGAMGVMMFSVGAFRLPGWARLRRRQMEEIAGRLTPVAESQSASDRDRLDPGIYDER
jgi:hypothetical protein